MPTKSQIIDLYCAYSNLSSAERSLHTEIRHLDEQKKAVAYAEQAVAAAEKRLHSAQEEVARLEALCGVKAK